MERQDDPEPGVDAGEELKVKKYFTTEGTENERCGLERRRLPGAAGLFDLGRDGQEKLFLVGTCD